MQHAEQQRLLKQLIPLLRQHAASLDSVGTSACLWALARLRYSQDSDLLEALLQRAASNFQLQQQQPWALAQSLWSCAHLRLQPSGPWLQRFEACCCSSMGAFTGRDCSQLLLAYAKLQLAPGRALLDLLLSRVHALLPELHAHAAANILYSLAVLHLAPGDAWVRSVLHAVQPQLHGYSHAALGLLGYSLAALHFRPSHSWLEAFFAASEQQLQEASPQNLSHFWMAAAAWHSRPPRSWLQQALAASYSSMHHFTAQGLAVTALSLVRLGCKPGTTWLRRFELQLCRQLPHVLPETLGSVMMLFGYAQHYPSSRSQAHLLHAATCMQQQFRGRSLAQLCTGLRLLPEWHAADAQLAAFATAAALQLPTFSPTSLAAVSSLLAARGVAPSSGWVLNASGMMASSMAAAATDDVVQFLEALASWEAQPGKWFWSAVSDMLCSGCSTLTAQQASRVLVAAQQLGGMREDALLALQLRLEDCAGQQHEQGRQGQQGSECSGDRYQLRHLGQQKVQQRSVSRQHTEQGGGHAQQQLTPHA
jgi:hypothetical protein